MATVGQLQDPLERRGVIEHRERLLPVEEADGFLEAEAVLDLLACDGEGNIDLSLFPFRGLTYRAQVPAVQIAIAP